MAVLFGLWKSLVRRTEITFAAIYEDQAMRLKRQIAKGFGGRLTEKKFNVTIKPRHAEMIGRRKSGKE